MGSILNKVHERVSLKTTACASERGRAPILSTIYHYVKVEILLIFAKHSFFLWLQEVAVSCAGGAIRQTCAREALVARKCLTFRLAGKTVAGMSGFDQAANTPNTAATAIVIKKIRMAYP